MDGWRWRAWVGHPDGGKLGAAFLVSPARLLTCAHTVAGMDEARVGFPGLSEDLVARVRRLSDWRRPGDPGDVALLELPAPVPFAPARLAGPGDLTEPRRDGSGADPLGRRTFGIWGFPGAATTTSATPPSRPARTSCCGRSGGSSRLRRVTGWRRASAARRCTRRRRARSSGW
ncbi:hypothetical protein ACFQHO_30260 [Actinomadura yumaensis]|uniref:hypothetical protein n=1 Tax=Actinomadura yumaensis TaxID=111807 RepID=UPI003621E7EB